jgi:zinc transport system permease protein
MNSLARKGFIMFELLQYHFMIHAFEAGIIIAIISPIIGVFLVLRRYSLIADTLSHVALAGVALGLFFKINPLLSAIATTVASSIVIDKLRTSNKVFGESALAIFLSGSLALAIVLIGLANGFNVNLFTYLFGSILTIKDTDVMVIGTLGIIVILIIIALYKELFYITFDEEAARVSGIATQSINTIFIILASLTIALAIPIVGALLISALLVIPAITALQFKKSFKQTIFIAEGISIFSVITGIITSFYLNLATGGTIVLITIAIFIIILLLKKYG